MNLKNFKKILIILSIIMVLSLTSCNTEKKARNFPKILLTTSIL